MDDNECLICLEELDNNICVLSCGHKYHYDCLTNWIKKKENLSNICCLCEKRCEVIDIISHQNNINYFTKKEFNNNKKYNCCIIL